MQEMGGSEGLHSDHLAMPKSPPGSEDATFSDEEDDVTGGQWSSWCQCLSVSVKDVSVSVKVLVFLHGSKSQ